jgi:protoporphyrinogen oxidase
VRGGYRAVFQKLVQEIERMGGVVLTNTPVQRVVTTPDGGVDLLSQDQCLHFDSVVATIPSRPLMESTPELSPDYARKLTEVKYLGIVCYALVLKRKLSPYYVTNLTDEGLPFTGIIEMTNLISGEETAGRHLVYLPKYTAPGDALFNETESDIWQLFWKGVKQAFPDLNESDVEQRFLFRERYVQPVPVLHYSDLVPEMQTNVEGLYLANTTQIINSTLNNNAMVKIARQAVDMVLQDAAKGALSGAQVDSVISDVEQVSA